MSGGSLTRNAIHTQAMIIFYCHSECATHAIKKYNKSWALWSSFRNRRVQLSYATQPKPQTAYYRVVMTLLRH